VLYIIDIALQKIEVLSVYKFFIGWIVIFGISVALTGNAEIHRWVDEKGTTHYGECPCDPQKFMQPSSASDIHGVTHRG
jgi:hypothetical protein